VGKSVQQAAQTGHKEGCTDWRRGRGERFFESGNECTGKVTSGAWRRSDGKNKRWSSLLRRRGWSAWDGGVLAEGLRR